MTDSALSPDAVERGINARATVNRLSSLASRRRLLMLLGLGGATAALLIWIGGGSDTIARIGEAQWSLVALAAAIHYGGFALRGHRWQLLLGVLSHRQPYLRITGLLITGWFVSALVPARAGDLVRIGALRLGEARPGQQPIPSVPASEALGSIVLERTLDILAILLLGAGFGFVVMQERLPDWLLWSYGVGLALLVSVTLAALLAPPLLLWASRRSSHPLFQRIVAFANQFVQSMRQILQHPRAAGLVVVESLLIWLCDGLLLWLVILALGQHVGMGSAAFVALTVDVVAAIPLTPGGLGQLEIAYAALLALLDLPVAVVPAAVLLTRGITYWSFLITSGAAAAWMGIGSLWQRLQRGAAESPDGLRQAAPDLPSA